MMRAFTFALTLLHFNHVQGWTEFGRERGEKEQTVQRNRLSGVPRMFESEEAAGMTRGIGNYKFLEDSLQDIIDTRSVLEVSLSMSMSMSYPTAVPPSHIPPSGPPGPTNPNAPTPVSMPSSPVGSPSSKPAMLPSSTPDGPTFEPTFSFEPSMSAFPVPVTPSASPSASPTNEPTVSYEPSTSASPTAEPTVSYEPSITASPTTEKCVIENGLSLGSSSDSTATPIFLAVGFQAESTSSLVDAFRTELENAMLKTAVAAVLGCEADFVGSVFPQTLEVATCTPTLDNATACFIMETEAIVFVKGPVNEDVAVFEAYQAIQNDMIRSRYIGRVATLLRLQFLSPLPLPVPPGSNQGTSEPIPVSSSRNGGANVNPWTIGASVASIMGGFVSILVWARARKFRQRRQQLMDETAWVNGDSPATA